MYVCMYVGAYSYYKSNSLILPSSIKKAQLTQREARDSLGI